MKKKIYFLIFMVAFFSASAQHKKADSLISVLRSVTDNKKKIELLKQLSDQQNDATIIIEYAGKGIALAEKLNQPKDVESFQYDLVRGYIKSYDYPKQLEISFKGLALSIKLHDDHYGLVFLNDISLGYEAGKEYQKAINYGLQGLHVAERIKEKKQYPVFFDNIGIDYLSLHRLDSAMIYLKKAYRSALEVHKPTIGYSISAMGVIEDSLHHKNLALSYYRQAIPFFKKSNFFRDRNLASGYVHIANIYMQTHLQDSAFYYASMAYHSAQQGHDLSGISTAARLLSSSYEGRNDKESLRYYKIAVAAQDSLLNDEKAKQFQIISLNERTREADLKQAAITYQSRVKLYGAIGGLIIVIAIAILLLLTNKKQRTANRLLYEQKQLIEGQAREAQIEAALERVRSRAMAMQKSDELKEVIQLIFDQLIQLNFDIVSANFTMDYREGDDFNMWIATADQAYPNLVRLPYTDSAVFRRAMELKKNNVTFIADQFTFEEKNEFFRYFFNQVPGTSAERQEFVLSAPGYVRSVAWINTVALGIYNYSIIPFSAEENAALIRFANVFEQAYTRFNDLKQAEAQVWEAKIEVALERVRSRTMAMFHSDELAETTAVLFQQLADLDLLAVSVDRISIGIVHEDTREIDFWITELGGDSISTQFKVKIDDNPTFLNGFNAWKAREKSFLLDLHGKELTDFLRYMRETVGVPVKEDVVEGHRFYNYVFFSQGLINTITSAPLSKENFDLLERFAGVFNLTYTRFLDLQKAEARAHEAVRTASLDRVRAKIASMRSTGDLQSITPIIWDELTILGVPFVRCGVFIVDEQQELINSYLSMPDGKAIAAFPLTFDAEGITKTVLPSWRKKQVSILHWNEEEFKRLSADLLKQGAITSEEKYLTANPPTSLDLHFIPFLQGMLYVGNPTPLNNDEINLVQSLADAFSTAYARYEDFNKLEAAKKVVEQTLTDLKSTQNQLIQSEKMASLGELTAGIAHEIQNPLNFVNNFSEVNTEMIGELEDELKSGNVDEALAIAAEIKGNEEKINHHGKRADAIVKGMLQHSKANSGQKESTNINILADEYMRLAYHGLRAKDKSFNAELTTLFDKHLPKINVIPQDIGRVLLNLFNNAFYAVHQKQTNNRIDYKPEITVATLSENDQLIIKVTDNGIGIPDAIKEKIMQPFFTTKPTGEGTGLGLSLSYDIVVKGHGGSIGVQSKDNHGSVFTITLPLS